MWSTGIPSNSRSLHYKQKHRKTWSKNITFTVSLTKLQCIHCKSIINIHLAQKVPQRFSKPAVCKYPATVNKSEIYILLQKPYSLMWHLVLGNHVRNGRDRRPKTRQKFLWTVCSTTQSTVESMMTRMMSAAFRCRRNCLSSQGLFLLIQWICACPCGSITAQWL